MQVSKRILLNVFPSVIASIKCAHEFNNYYVAQTSLRILYQMCLKTKRLLHTYFESTKSFNNNGSFPSLYITKMEGKKTTLLSLIYC